MIRDTHPASKLFYDSLYPTADTDPNLELDALSSTTAFTDFYEIHVQSDEFPDLFNPTNRFLERVVDHRDFQFSKSASHAQSHRAIIKLTNR